jgi:hypothetical protein
MSLRHNPLVNSVDDAWKRLGGPAAVASGGTICGAADARRGRPVFLASGPGALPYGLEEP